GTTPGAGWLFFESPSRSSFFLEHDLFRKPVPPFRDHALYTLQRALGLHRDLDGGVRRAHAPKRPQLLVALLVARDLDVLGVDVLAEAGDLVGAERVGAGDDATAVLDP